MGRKRKSSAEDEPTVEAVALVRRGLGHALIRMEIPHSHVEEYATTVDAPEIRAVVAARLLEWVERVP